MTQFQGFSWIAFCNRHGIPYVERGANVARGHVNIKCPFCGEADPSEHLGLNTTETRWGCWRSSDHRGKSPVYLIAALLGITKAEAYKIAESFSSPPRIELPELQKLVRKLDAPTRKIKKKKPKDVPAPEGTFRIGSNPEDAPAALSYLRARGFTERLRRFLRYYAPRYAHEGKFKMRITFPVGHGGKVQGYVGRVVSQSSLRYKAYPEGEWLRDYVWNYDRCWSAASKYSKSAAKALIIQEGIFDASKIDHYGRDFGVRSVALLGLSLSAKKLNDLIVLCRRYPKVWLCLDRGAEAQALEMQRSLVLGRAQLLWLPEGYKDAGEMSPAEAKSFARSAL